MKISAYSTSPKKNISYIMYNVTQYPKRALEPIKPAVPQPPNERSNPNYFFFGFWSFWSWGFGVYLIISSKGMLGLP